MKVQRWTGTDGESALYVDGKLSAYGDHRAIDAEIAKMLSVEEHQGNDFLRGDGQGAFSTVTMIEFGRTISETGKAILRARDSIRKSQ